MSTRIEIPIFPLGTVLYPAGRLALRIFETRYVEMTKACIRDNSVFGVTLIKAGYEAGTPAVPCETGCTARIIEWDVPNPGLFTLTTQGESVFRIVSRRTRADGLILGEVELLDPPDPVSLPDRYDGLAKLLIELIEGIGEDNFPKPHRLDDAAWVGNRLAELLPIAPERKQQLLEEGSDPLAMLGTVEQLLKQLRDER